MKHEAELIFFQNLLKNYNIPYGIIRNSSDIESVYWGISKFMKPIWSQEDLFRHLVSYCSPNTIYRFRDSFLCHYLFFRFPEEECFYFIIGPYMTGPETDQDLVDLLIRIGLSPAALQQAKNAYRDIPVISDDSALLTLVNTFGQQIWGGIDRFTLEDILDTDDLNPLKERYAADPDASADASLNMKLLEERYARENNLMQAITLGQTHRAEMIINTLRGTQLEERTTPPIRNLKNYAIITNTLFRKAAEAGAVHPFYIDGLSSDFARQIEQARTVEAVYQVLKKMAHKYCLLVKNHSMKGYSLLVSKVLTRIDSDLTADLSLKAQADLLEVNSSYLSALFKKETGTSLTEYVNRKRVEHGIFLLNSTSLQIQSIAQRCGIPDVNYFTKIFKKYVKMTPMEYRRSLFPYNTMDTQYNGRVNRDEDHIGNTH